MRDDERERRRAAALSLEFQSWFQAVADMVKASDRRAQILYKVMTHGQRINRRGRRIPRRLQDADDDFAKCLQEYEASCQKFAARNREIVAVLFAEVLDNSKDVYYIPRIKQTW
ncbi:MAG TPA: hypothetical protein VGG62_10660 [Terracidiphilus sp.]